MFVTGFLQRATLDKSLCFARGIRASFFTYLLYFAYIAIYICTCISAYFHCISYKNTKT